MEQDLLIDQDLVGGPVAPCPSGDPDCVVLGGGVVCPHRWTIPPGETEPVRVPRQPEMALHWWIAGVITIAGFWIQPWVPRTTFPWIILVVLLFGLRRTRRERERIR